MAVRGEVKLLTVRARSGLSHERLDAGFFVSPGVAARERLTMLRAGGVDVQRLGDLASVWQPMRFARAWAAPDEPGVEYLRPYDCFEYLPASDNRLSSDRTEHLDRLLVKPEMILQTCSGRNLGPVILADTYLSRFALSHDMARIEIADRDLRYYVLVFLSTPTGRALIRQGMSGSVIDHLSAERLSDVPVAILKDLVKAIAEQARKAVTMRAKARIVLADALAAGSDALPMPHRAAPAKAGWTVRARSIGSRLDAAFNDPVIDQVRAQVKKAGGRRCGDLAAAFLPHRYKRYYVEPPNGRPTLSGRGLLQYEPINLRHVSDRSFEQPVDYELRTGMVVFGAAGRAEGRLAGPALVTSDRDGWLASDDVIRLIPRAGTRPAALWLAVASPQVQAQIKTLSFGSVIDHMKAWDVDEVLLPLVDSVWARRVGEAWEKLAESNALLADARKTLEFALRDRAGERAGSTLVC
jgi:hypothetical protein